MKSIARLSALANTLLKYFVGLLLLCLMFITVIDVIGRYGFNAPLPGANELTELVMGVLVFAALPLVTVRSEHITISLLENLFKGWVKRVQQEIIRAICMTVMITMSWRLWLKGDELASYSDTSSYLHVPLAPIAYFMSVMAAFSALLLILMILVPITVHQASTQSSG